MPLSAVELRRARRERKRAKTTIIVASVLLTWIIASNFFVIVLRPGTLVPSLNADSDRYEIQLRQGGVAVSFASRKPDWVLAEVDSLPAVPLRLHHLSKPHATIWLGRQRYVVGIYHRPPVVARRRDVVLARVRPGKIPPAAGITVPLRLRPHRLAIHNLP